MTAATGVIQPLSIGDAGDGFDDGAGWIAGTNLTEKIESGGPAIPPHRLLNLITIEHPINTNNRSGKGPKWGTQGIGSCGLNNPLSSGHPGAVMVAFGDGHVQRLANDIAIEVLKRLAIRDDGGELPNGF